ncbi:endonuclease domain-containing protein [Sphingomonas sp. LaA6.9]|uniref:endonuclease domain-containing protein n=1 Tax=Sphingomonas sp. LaA6.9 TaxID=2919914 RepID=UPI001F5002E3|nr:endonuclease domain-containing protein [Sphingomonas sp. LaA6.9]MCJ8156007.1 endonuclease domain-containing protein [Sphingomonas sp. LaA6.9]
MPRDIAPKGGANSVKSARRLRRAMTFPEVLIWRALRGRTNGLKFRRQHPTGRYILDFFCSDARLVFEIDGEAHDRGDRPARDEARDAWLHDNGLEVLRLPARDVLDDLDSTVRMIIERALARLPLHHPAAPGGPPPRGKLGEE